MSEGEGVTMSEAMTTIAFALDRLLNGEDIVKNPDTVQRSNGFVLLMYPFGEHEGRCNFISNGASKEDVMKMFEHQLEQFRRSDDDRSKPV